MFRRRLFGETIGCFLIAELLCGCSVAKAPEQELLTAAGKPAEGPLGVFLGKPVFDRQVVFEGDKVREPYLAISVDGTLLAVRTEDKQLRSSEDGGKSWGEIIDVSIAMLDSNMIVDEKTGDIMSVRMWNGADKVFLSTDDGKTWTEKQTTIKLDGLLERLAKTGLKQRVSKAAPNQSGTYYLEANATESGITLRHGKHKGRLLVGAGFMPHVKEPAPDRDPADAMFGCAIYSDDRGATWKVSGLFPEGYTGEAALVELHDGRVYYNVRRHRDDKTVAPELRPDESMRREAWSDDGGETWKDLNVSKVLPDGGGFGRGYGMKGGLTRLPIENRDVLIFSNTDTGGGDREKVTVWASFDGAKTWPVKRLVYASPSAYSSLVAGRPDTPSEGLIYMLFEGGPDGMYSAMQVARFNLSWILGGERTGNGDVPQWVLP